MGKVGDASVLVDFVAVLNDQDRHASEAISR